jgi:DNA-binding CsgD family transcriptional regulator
MKTINLDNLPFELSADLCGNYVVSSTYNKGNIYQIDVTTDYDYVPDDELAKKIQLEDEVKKSLEKIKKVRLKNLFSQKSKLSKRQQQVLNLWLEGKTYVEMALILNISESAIRQSLMGNSLGQGGIIRKLTKLLKDP